MSAVGGLDSVQHEPRLGVEAVEARVHMEY